jgi:hypothetical protein
MTKPPLSRTRRMREAAAAQQNLFDAPTPAAKAPAQILVAIPTPAAKQNKAQRAFNRLIVQIQQQRALLVQWQDFELRYHQRLATEMQPVEARLHAARRALLLLLDDLLLDTQATPKLSKTQRRKLSAWVPQLAGQLLDEGGPDAEVEALFNRYSDVSHADLRQVELAEAEAMLGQVLGEDAMQGHGAESVDDLMRHAAQHLAGQAAEQAAGQAANEACEPSPAQGRRAEAQRERQEAAAKQAAKEAGQSVREAFRRLASALHPDRETDAGERERKTRLMQQANDAYGRNDLLTLLTMQLDLEQIDGQHLANLPDERLAHYNQVLREQLALLQQEVSACVEPYRGQVGPDSRGLTPVAVEASLTRGLAELVSCAREIERDIVLLREPGTRRAVINALELPAALDDEPDAFEMMLMMGALAAAPPAPGRRKKRR